MNNIMKSATKLVLLSLTLWLIVMSLMQMAIPAEYKDAIMLVLAFYFGQKTNTLP
jgi:uncharacterized membrane protein